MIQLALIAVALAAAAITATAAYAYRRLFVPDQPEKQEDFTFTPWEFQVDCQELELKTADGVTFGAWWFRQPASPQVIVVSPGHKGQRQATLGVCVALWRKGFNVISYSYRGMPGSDRATITMGIREVNELQAVIAAARQKVKGARVALLGFSMGAVVSLLGAAGEPGVEALVLDSPFSDLTKLLRERIRKAIKVPGPEYAITALVGAWFKVRTGESLSEASPINVLSALEPRPLFFIHGGADAVTSVQHSRRLYDAYRGPREIWVVQGAPHTGAYFADRDLYVERVAGFFGRHLGLAKAAGLLRLIEDEVG